MTKLRAYFVDEEGADYGVGVIAESAKEAKKIAWDENPHDTFFDTEWINVRSKWSKKVNTEGLSKGVIDDLEGLKRGLYGYFEEMECPRCGTDNTVYWDEELKRFYCSYCEEKADGELSLSPKA